MSHLPYGYRIENGMPIIDQKQAEALRRMYEGYLSGLSLTGAAKAVNLNRNHASAKRMLRNKKYLGDDFYPQIIDKDIFDRAEQEIQARADKLGRNNYQHKAVETEVNKSFHIGIIVKEYDDPYKQAEYIYRLIRKGERDGTG